MADLKPESGAIRLDNQWIQVDISFPSGRFRVYDKVSGIEWVMQDGEACGAMEFERDGKTFSYSLGEPGQEGVLFLDNYYSIRSDEKEDFHEVRLSGPLGDDAKTLITLRFLLSTVNPCLDCCLFVTSETNRVPTKIIFPLGFEFPLSPANRLYLPLDLASLKPLEELSAQLPLWEPVDRENHVVNGAPFVILIRKQDTASGACLGFLSDPIHRMEIKKTAAGRTLSILSTRPSETGYTEFFPHSFQYRFFPSGDLPSVYWLCHEALQLDE